MPAPIARILIVDDEAAQMTALVNTLRDEGYDTTGFTTARDALAALKEHRFDLLLTDLMMPEMDGIALLRAAQLVDSQLVGVLMTGQGTIDTAVQAMKAGALDYVLKPFKLSSAIAVLSRALAMRRLRVENAALEQRVKEHTRALEAANRELEAFASSVAHDLRSPARHICGYVQMLREDCAGELSANAMHRLASISAAAERMTQLITDLLAFSRLARSEMHRAPVDLGYLAGQVRREMDFETNGRAIDWKIGALPIVQGDKSMLLVMLQNLFSNAVKFTRQRDLAQIEIGCQDHAGAPVYFIRDNGAGFDMRYADKLFGVFQRLHRHEEFEGTGVGLSIVQRIIHRHGGRIWAQAEPSKGATFFFTLPSTEPQPGPGIPAETPNQAAQAP
jgi:two-component system, sensor histidine kinase and response regulator